MGQAMFKSPQTRGEMSRSPPASVNGGVNALESSEAGPSPSPSSLNNSSTASAASTGAPTQLKLTENPERRMSAGQPSSSPPLAEIIFPDEEISKYLAPHPDSVEPDTHYFVSGRWRPSILNNIQQERVCSAVGKVQEQEILKVKGLSSTSLQGCYWIRSSPNDSHSSYEFVQGSENSDCYTLTARDENCYLSFQQSCRGKDVANDAPIVCRRAINSIGPVLPGPPRLLDLRIVGKCIKGEKVFAESDYIGGTEGLSEYWWFRIKGGKRVQIGEPRVVSDFAIKDIKECIGGAIDKKECLNDPRVLELSEEDLGCVLKVKCRPVRVDGYKGEVFTSKPSPIIVESEDFLTVDVKEIDVEDGDGGNNEQKIEVEDRV